MRRFRDTVEDIKAPSPQSLWLDKGELKSFGTKGWTSIVGGGGDNSTYLYCKYKEDNTSYNKSACCIYQCNRSSKDGKCYRGYGSWLSHC